MAMSNKISPKLSQRIEEAIHEEMIPGMGIVLGNATEKIELYLGNITYDKNSPAVFSETMYDVASLTKLFTAAAVLRAVTSGKLQLEDSIGDILDAPALRDVHIIHALSHTSGVSVQFSKYKEEPDTLRVLALTTAPSSQPGTEYWYANVNYYLLGLVLEKIYRIPMDMILQKHIFDPLKMFHSRYCPPESQWPQIAPTEIDPWRNKVVQGFVHDESTYALGGITGYAGVFSTAPDLFKFALLYLEHGKVHEKQLIDETLLEASIRVTFPHAPEAPIFETKHGFSGFRINPRKRVGKLASQHVYEFSGFTGPSIIVDPDRNLAAAFVDNRTYPKRPTNFDPLIQFRAELFEIICEEVGIALE
jgi:CubicO group peptidase (beta-lactamase class C family)